MIEGPYCPKITQTYPMAVRVQLEVAKEHWFINDHNILSSFKMLKSILDGIKCEICWVVLVPVPVSDIFLDGNLIRLNTVETPVIQLLWFMIWYNVFWFDIRKRPTLNSI